MGRALGAGVRYSHYHRASPSDRWINQSSNKKEVGQFPPASAGLDLGIGRDKPSPPCKEKRRLLLVGKYAHDLMSNSHSDSEAAHKVCGMPTIRKSWKIWKIFDY